MFQMWAAHDANSTCFAVLHGLLELADLSERKLKRWQPIWQIRENRKSLHASLVVLNGLPIILQIVMLPDLIGMR